MEFVRSIKVHIEIDTNKQTYETDILGDDFEDIRDKVEEFVERTTDVVYG